MKAIVSNPDGPVITTADDPRPGSGEALVAVRAFSVNRGELALLRARTDGWRPGQDIAGVVAEPAADGSGPSTKRSCSPRGIVSGRRSRGRRGPV